MEKIKNILKSKFFWFAIILVVVAVFFLNQRSSSRSVEFSSSTVERLDLVQSVSETGYVIADLEIAYGWEVAGKVAEVLKDVGDEVKKEWNEKNYI